MAYLGNDLKVAYPTYVNIDDISGSFNGSTTSFALLVSGAAPVPLPLNSQQCLISVAGVLQRPDDTGAEGFRLSGGNIVFSSAPATGADFFGVILAGADYVNAGATYPDGSAAVPSITFDQDTDTGFYRSGSGVVSFSSNSVQAAILATTSLTAPSFIPTSSTVPTNGVYLPSANNVAISTNSQGRLFVNSSGNVGIGTTSPSQLLHVNSSSNDSRIYLGNSSALSHSFIGALVGDLYVSNEVAGAVIFRQNATERARIDTSGRLLVGTSSARTGFFDGVVDPSLQVEGSTTASSSLSVTRNSNDADGPRFIFGRSRSTGNTVLQSGDRVGGITYQGNDGAKFVRAAEIECFVDATPGTNDMPGRLVFSTTADGASSPTERMRITSGGELLVGGTNDNGAFNIQCNGTGIWGFGAYVNGSDERLKENIHPLPASLDVVKALNPVAFQYKSEFTADTSVQPGFIAQELQVALAGQDYLEGVVQTGPEYLSVAYQSLIPVLTKALQEAAAKIETLEAKVAALEGA